MTKLEACKVLGVTLGSTRRQIQSAYREKAREVHPDRCRLANAVNIMAQVNLAYETMTSSSTIDPSLSRDFRDLFGTGLDDLKI